MFLRLGLWVGGVDVGFEEYLSFKDLSLASMSSRDDDDDDAGAGDFVGVR